MADNGQISELLCQLVDIPSTFPAEKDLLLFLENKLVELGFQIKRIPVEQDRWNIHIRIGSGSPVVCFNTHADTVPPNGRSQPKAVIKDGKLYGLGSCDAKASITAMITALSSLRSGPPAGTIDLIISVDEEGDAKGIKTAIKQGYHCDYAVVGEPTGLDVVRAHCGLLFFDVTTTGLSTHGSTPWNGISAIKGMFELSQAIQESVSSLPSDPVVGSPSLNLGAIHGGDRPNRVPDSCTASFDVRLVSPANTDDIITALESLLVPYIERGASWKIMKRGEPLFNPEDSVLVSKLHAAALERTKGRSRVIGWRGWTEAEPFQIGLGIDAVVFGPGNLQQAHSGDEYVDLNEVMLAAQCYEQLARDICKA